MLISAGLIYILTWPIQQLVADTAAEQARAEVGLLMGGIFSGTMQLIDAKVGEIAEGVAVDILSGLRLYSLLLAEVRRQWSSSPPCSGAASLRIYYAGFDRLCTGPETVLVKM